jgi:hypothetical protein
MMYCDSDIHMTMDSWSALTLSAILVLYTIICFIYRRKFANLCIMVSHILYSYILIQLLCYPDGFLYNVPNILDVCSLNQIGSLQYSVSGPNG